MSEEPAKKRIVWGDPPTDKGPQAGASEVADAGPRIRSAFETRSAAGTLRKRRRFGDYDAPAPKKRAACSICNRSHRKGPCP